MYWDDIMQRWTTVAAVAVLAALPQAALWAAPLAGEQAAVHVLNRLAYGPRPGDIDIAAADTVMNQPSRELLAAIYPGVALRSGRGEFDTLLDIDKARRLLGYVPAHSWRDHLAG